MKKTPVKKTIDKRKDIPKKEKTRKSYFKLLGVGLIVLLGSIIYSNSIHAAFQYDDFWIIVNNIKIQNLSDVSAWMGFFPTRPVAVFTFALNYHFSQLNVASYHYMNVLIHLITAILIWWITLLLFSSPVGKNHSLAKHRKPIALLVALMFVSHPLATEAVTYITQRMASLAAMFYLLSAAIYMHARINGKGNIQKILLYTASFAAGILAVFTKENAFTLPFAIVMLELFFIRTSKIQLLFRDYRFYLVTAGFLALFALLYFRFSTSIFNPIPPILGHSYTITPQNYFFTQGSVIVKYLQLLLLPVNQNLDYDYAISNSFFEVRTLLSFAFLLVLLIGGILLYKKNRLISFGIFWFFLTLSVESSIIPLNDFIDDYRLYLPSFGFFIAISCTLFIFLREKYKVFLFSLFVLIIASNSVLTYQMNGIWKDDLSLWSDVVSKSPKKARPYINRGLAYQNTGQMDKALADYSKAIVLSPNYSNAYYNRGIVYQMLKEWDNSIADLSMAIKIDPTYVDAVYNRGYSYSFLGKWDQAIENYNQAIKLDPQYADVYSNRAMAYGNLGKWDKAIADYSIAIEIEPKNADTYSNRGTAYASLEQWENAIKDFSKAIELKPEYLIAYNNRGFAYGKLEQWNNAIADFTKALAIDPNNEMAFYQREAAQKKLSGGATE